MTLPRSWTQSGGYFTPLRLQLLTRMIERELNRELHAAFQISVAEWRILALTCTSGPMNAADIAASFEADPGQISRAVAVLIRKGLIQRERQIGAGNNKKITPTPHGHEVFEGLHEKRQAYFRTIMRDLSADDTATLERILEMIALRVDEERSAPEGA
jgi:DNA-binding MarR family transcriptional regulator